MTKLKAAFRSFAKAPKKKLASWYHHSVSVSGPVSTSVCVCVCVCRCFRHLTLNLFDYFYGSRYERYAIGIHLNISYIL